MSGIGEKMIEKKQQKQKQHWLQQAPLMTREKSSDILKR